jgi:LEA14-like dessication related protein
MHRFALLVLIASLVLLGGCESVQKLLADMDKPTASIKGVRFASLSLDQVGLVFDIEVDNPYAVAMPLTNIDYGLASGGAALASGQASLDGVVPARGSRVIAMPVNLAVAELLKAGSDMRPGKVLPYKADLGLSVDAPGVGPLKLPMSHSGEVPVPAVPRISLQSVDFQSLTLSEASAVLKVDIENTNEFPIDLNALGYALSLGGTPITTSTVAEPTSFQPGQQRGIEIPIRFQPSSLGVAAFNMLRGNDASFELKGDLQLGTRFGAISLPYRQQGTTRLRR